VFDLAGAVVICLSIIVDIALRVHKGR